MLGLTSIPLLALIILNLIVIYYVFREKQRTTYRFFLTINSTLLIIYAVSFHTWYSEKIPFFLTIYTLTSLLLAANILIFSLENPQLLTSGLNKTFLRITLFALPFLAFLGWNISEVSAARAEETVVFTSWIFLWRAEGGYPLLMLGIYLVVTLIVLPVQYLQTKEQYLKNLPRHLIFLLACPIIFILFFSVFSNMTSRDEVSLIPSPTFTLGFIAQMMTLLVVRQVETKRPLYLSRWIYYSIIVVLGFLFSSLLDALYEAITQDRLLAPQIRMTILVTIVCVIVAGSFRPVQAIFDRLMFSRAYEYRQLVLEAQTELTETREQLRQAERLSVVGELAAQIAHEIKNPLGPIKGYTQMMKAKIEKLENFQHKESFLRHLDIIAEEVQTIDGKVHHLLDLSKRQDMSVQEENINKMVERAAILLRLEAETLAADVTTKPESVVVLENLEKDLPKVECNRARVEEILMNICRNAFEARTHSDTTIELSTKAKRNKEGTEGIEITVADNGKGIDQMDLERIFDPFFTSKKSGTGLGLAIVKSHINLHQGSIKFSAREEGGTEVKIWLPTAFGGKVVHQSKSGKIVATPMPISAEDQKRESSDQAIASGTKQDFLQE